MSDRVIKFRAYIKKYNNILEIISIDFSGGWIETIDGNAMDLCETWDFAEVELMQFTGLHDRNGVEIFEGDILKYKPYYNLGHSERFDIKHVEWGRTGDSDGYAHGHHEEWVIYEDSLADIADSEYPEESYCEVIGNIYSNPELLKEQGNEK